MNKLDKLMGVLTDYELSLVKKWKDDPDFQKEAEEEKTPDDIAELIWYGLSWNYKEPDEEMRSLGIDPAKARDELYKKWQKIKNE